VIELASKLRKEISAKELKEICSLKDQYWKHGLKSQLLWFKKNIKKNDICNILKINKRIIGLTILRKRTLVIGGKRKKYILFDTLIISKKYRKKNLSKFLMILNNYVILKKNLISLLFCKKKLIKFYEKFGWSQLNNKNFKVIDYNFNTYALIFNSDFKNYLFCFYTKI
tara:strand:- start:294 stop:800 length:507 start_codon:yes stop_codon:yes gene_type:complete